MATFVQQPCDEVLIHSKAAVAPCARTSGPWILAATILGSSMALLTGPLSTWRCQPCSKVWVQLSLTFNGSSNRTRFCFPHCCSWEDHWEITTAGAAFSSPASQFSLSLQRGAVSRLMYVS